MNAARRWSLPVWIDSRSLGHAAYETQEPVDFTLAQLGGDEMSLSDYRGEWVVVNYWATWCAPCRKEMPELSLLHEERRR